MSYRRVTTVGTVLVLASALAGCGGDGGSPPSRDTAVATMAIRNFAFVPPILQVIRGQEITVTNDDEAPHTITAVNGSFDSGRLIQGESFTFTIASSGAAAYICDLHQYMKGSIEVL